MSLKKAIIILGSTGSGKTPLGEYLEKNGLNGRKCFHFDFGACLRHVVDFGKGFDLNLKDILVIRKALKENALLENETFYIAEKILSYFQRTRGVTENDLLILNGLPRHIDQAEDTAKLVDPSLIAFLEATPETAFIRVIKNTGGDRDGRSDDTIEDITNKLKIFEERTRPLIEYYKSKGVQIVNMQVDAVTKAADSAKLIAEAIR